MTWLLAILAQGDPEGAAPDVAAIGPCVEQERPRRAPNQGAPVLLLMLRLADRPRAGAQILHLIPTIVADRSAPVSSLPIRAVLARPLAFVPAPV